MTIPSFATNNLNSTYYAPSFRFTMQHSLTEKLNLGYNLGEEWDDETQEGTFIYTITTGYSFTDKIGGYIEFYGFAQEQAETDHRYDCGVSYLLKPNILLDVSGGFGLTRNSPKFYVALGFSCRFKD